MGVVQVNNLNRTIDDLKKLNIWVAGLEDGPMIFRRWRMST